MGFAITLIWKTVLFFLGHSSFPSESQPDILLTIVCFIGLLCFLFSL